MGFMPTSQHYQIPKLIDIIIDLNPMSLLDIGVGFGKYGFLAREYLELWDGSEDYTHFKRRIDGIEVYPTYLTPVHDYIYNTIYIGNALEVVPTIKQHYDLVMIIDVLEHFEKDEGTKLLKQLLHKGKGVLVSVPKDIGDQGEVFGNTHETHHAEWRKSDFAAIAPCYFIEDTTSIIAYLGTREDIKRMKKTKLKRRIWRLASASPLAANTLRKVSSALKKHRNK
jgi:hypothetical protein